MPQTISTLVVAAAEVSGSYTCLAWNEVGNRTWSTPFYVDGERPLAVTFIYGTAFSQSCCVTLATLCTETHTRENEPQNEECVHHAIESLQGANGKHLAPSLQSQRTCRPKDYETEKSYGSQ